VNVIATVLSLLLATVCVASAIGDLRHHPRIMATMERLEVPVERVRWLAVIKVSGAAGLLIGISVQWLQVTAAALLTLYFIGAVASHARVRDRFAELAPALVLTMVAALASLASLSR
jgi:uncharacterized membrane protein YphA (DoxX/SURF4 family)